jgi:hypothetical protein
MIPKPENLLSSRFEGTRRLRLRDARNFDINFKVRQIDAAGRIALADRLPQL